MKSKIFLAMILTGFSLSAHAVARESWSFEVPNLTQEKLIFVNGVLAPYFEKGTLIRYTNKVQAGKRYKVCAQFVSLEDYDKAGLDIGNALEPDKGHKYTLIELEKPCK